MSEASGAAGEGFATISRNGIPLDAWVPKLELANGGVAGTRQIPSDTSGYGRTDPIRGIEVVPIRTEIASLQDAPVDVHDAYLRLHLLSHRLVRPNTINLDGIFQLIPTVAWTTLGRARSRICSRRRSRRA
jgi:2,3,4,5-tetrahydropyridine-2-carboxylate N-succinyltransferase